MSQPRLEMSWRMRTFQKKVNKPFEWKKQAETKFKWSDKLVNDLLNALSNFKSTMEFKSKDFNADKPRQYEEVRKEIVRIDSDNEKYFGPVDLPTLLSDIDDENEIHLIECQRKKANESIRQGYKRIMEKIRNAFSTAITIGRRSGAGRIIMENYDKLVLIYGGAPSVEPLVFGSDTASGTHIDDYNNDDEGRCSDEDIASTHHAASNNNSPSNNSSNNNSINGNSSSLKRKNTDNPVPKLIDEKRRQLEKDLSARQRDQLLLSEAKEDNLLRKEMCDALKESNKMFAEAMATMSASFVQVADSMRKSMEQLANMNTQMISSSNFSYAHTPERFGCSSRVVPQTSTPNIYHDRTILTSNQIESSNPSYPATESHIKFGAFRSFL